MPHANIHCFELNQKTFTNLTFNVQDLKNIHLNNFGLSNKDAEVSFSDFGENHGANSLVIDQSFARQSKPLLSVSRVSTGERYMEEKKIEHIDFLKIDVEGWEYFVIEGFGKYLTPQHISIIQFEYGYSNGDVHKLMRDVYKLLEPKGYVIGKLRQDGVKFSAFHHSMNDFKSGPNFIACDPKLVSHLSTFD
jgi:FkbM family methyltransferase